MSPSGASDADALPRNLGELVSVTGPDGSTALVSTHGAHVVSWRSADGRERLFVSSLADASTGAAIRGGIPVCFPQFADLGPLPKHGFARTGTWAHVGDGRFLLDIGADSRDGWRHPCRLSIGVTLGPSTMTVAFGVENTGDAPLPFTGALHTYLRCDDITSVTVAGLDGCAVRSGARVQGDISFGDGTSDVDLSVFAPVGPVTVSGISAGGTGGFVCAQTGFPDVVVWNVGERLGGAMSDLGSGEWRNYVCVEAAAVAAPVTVAPTHTWTGTQTVLVR